MIIYLPIDLDADEQREVQRRVTTDWLLYGQVHMTNAPRGRGLTFLNPVGIKYTPQPSDPFFDPAADSTADSGVHNEPD